MNTTKKPATISTKITTTAQMREMGHTLVAADMESRGFDAMAEITSERASCVAFRATKSQRLDFVLGSRALFDRYERELSKGGVA